MVCQGINTISMTSDTPASRQRFILKFSTTRCSSKDKEKEEQWYQGGKDKKTALAAMKTDPLYQLNSDEKASLAEIQRVIEAERRVPSFAETSTFRELDIIIRSESNDANTTGLGMARKETRTAQLLDLSAMYSSKKLCS